MLSNVYQFKITLIGSDPLIWRRIAVPEDYSFWDLHVAIQDSMGWQDCHLHAFKESEKVDIGIPSEDDTIDDFKKVLPGWKIKIAEYFKTAGEKMMYEYDFGDGWEHEVLFETISTVDKKIKYPKRLDGANACPPEDCGGIYGYYEMLDILKKARSKRYKEITEWLGDTFKPDHFNCKEVEFDNPSNRLKMMLSSM